MSRQILLRLPDELALRFRTRVPARQRSAFVQRLLEHALSEDEDDQDPLYLAAMAVEKDERLAEEMSEWDGALADGL